MAIQFVGAVTGGTTAGTGSLTISLTALTGGIGTAPIQGDVIVVASGISAAANLDPGVTSPAAVEVADLYANGTSNDANLSVAYIVVGATPPTSLTVVAASSNANGSSAVVGVFRGVDNINPMDVTPTTAGASGGPNPNPPSITPATTNSWALAISCTSSDAAGTFSNSTGYTQVGDRASAGTTRSIGVQMLSRSGMTGGVLQDPTAQTYSQGGNGSSWVAATLVLRPSLGRVKVWTGSAWVAEPIKVWNGSAWILEPAKHWNGTAWVVTNY